MALSRQSSNILKFLLYSRFCTGKWERGKYIKKKRPQRVYNPAGKKKTSIQKVSNNKQQMKATKELQHRVTESRQP